MKYKTLQNGLETFIFEDHRTPTFSFVILYRVGSMDEHPGITGVSHIIEHMVFKGSDTVDGNELNKHVRRHGGMLNAGTSEDMTLYFMAMPKSEREYPMKIWSDLMTNATFDEKEFISERDVVVEERRLRSEDDPVGALFEALKATAFWAHPYRWPVIGWMDDITSVTRDKVYDFYKRFYSPDNATIIAAGDIDAGEIQGMIEKYFGSIPAGEREITRTKTAEPVQTGMRRSKIRKPAQLPVVMIGFHAPNLKDDKVYPLLVVEKILSSGESSRIYQNIIHEKRLAVSAGGVYDYVTRDPSMFIFFAQAAPDKDANMLEEAIWEEIDSILSGDIELEEIEKAKNIVEATFLYRREKTLTEAYLRGQFHLVADMELYDMFEERIRKVTKEDVLNVCSSVLTRDNATVVDLEPLTGNGVSSGNGVSMLNKWFFHEINPNCEFESSSQLPDGLPYWDESEKFILSNGIQVIAYHRDHLPIIQIGLTVNAGGVYDPIGKAGLANLTGNMIKAGTVSRSAYEIAEEIERVGGQFDIAVQREICSIGIRCMSRHLKIALDILSECLIYPAFENTEVTRYKELQSGDIKAVEDDVWKLTPREFVRNLYRDSPYGQPVLGDLSTVDSLTQDDIKTFHSEHFTGSNMILAIIGDFDKTTLKDELEFYFSSLLEGIKHTPSSVESIPYEKPVISRYDKKLSQASIALGGYGFPRKSDDFFPYLILDHIFGGDSLSSRLGQTVREKHGLAYFIQSSFQPNTKAGFWNVLLQTGNETVQKAIDLIRNEMQKLHSEPVTDDELKDAKSSFRGRSAFEVESNQGLAMKLMAVAYHDLGDDYLSCFFKNIDSITREQVNEVAQKYLNPDNILLLIVGDEDATAIEL